MIKFFLNLLYSIKTHNIKNKNIKNILLLSPSCAVGDTIIETFFIKELKKIYPNSKLTVFISEQYKCLLQYNKDVDYILTMPIGRYTKLLYLLYKLLYLRKQKYDLLIDIPWSGYAPFRYIFLYFINANQVMSSNILGYNFITYNLIWNKKSKKHITEEIFIPALKMLKDKQTFDIKYNLFVPNKSITSVENFIHKHKIVKKIFLVNPEGANKKRVLSINKTLNLISLIKNKFEKDYEVILLAHKIKYPPNLSNILIFYTNSIMDTIALVKKSNYILTVDTGIVHIGDTFKKNMTILYSELNNKKRFRHFVEYFWGSLNQNNKFLKDPFSVNNINLNDIVLTIQKHMDELLKN